MPHIPGHIKNSFIRKDKVFDKKVGILYPHYEGSNSVKNWNNELVKIPKGVMTDYPILFFHNGDNQIKYGQYVRFLPYIVDLSLNMKHPQQIIDKGQGKFLVIAMNLVDGKVHDDLDKLKVTGPSPQKDALENIEKIYKASPNYEIIYGGNNTGSGDRKLTLSKDEEADTNRAIEWIIQHAVPFDEMNLGTN